MDLAGQCGFNEVPCWETFRARFKLLEEKYGNQIAVRQGKILQGLERAKVGKKALTAISGHRKSKRVGLKGDRNNHVDRKAAIKKSMPLRAMIRATATKGQVNQLFFQGRWPDGKPRCPRGDCGSDRVVEEPGEQPPRWVCLDCEERFDIKTRTTFEGARHSLETIFDVAYLMLQIPFGMPSEIVPLLVEDEDRRLSHKDSVYLTHRIQTALVERLPIFDGPAQYDTSLLGYADGVEIHVHVLVDVPTRQARAEITYGPVTKAQAGRFIYKYLKEDGILFTDTTKACPDSPYREMVNHAICEFSRASELAPGYFVNTNLPENFWSTFKNLIDRRRGIAVVYLPLYLAEHMWRYNHRDESTEEQLQKFIRNAHDVVLRGDDKPCDVGEVEGKLAALGKFVPPPSRASRVHRRRPRSRRKKENDFMQLRLA